MFYCLELRNSALKGMLFKKFRYWPGTSALGSHLQRGYSKTELKFVSNW